MHALEIVVRLDPENGAPWRRFAIAADASLGELHEAIQAACGWEDRHLYAFIQAEEPFTVRGWTIAERASERGAPDPAKVPMATVLRAPGQRVTYWYDFGDDWMHDVFVNGLLESGPGRALLGGELAFPPEDCGGMHGYSEVAQLVRRTAGLAGGGADLDEEDRARLEWLSGWDPDRLDRQALARTFDRKELSAPKVPEAPSIEAILGGMRVSRAVSESCERMRASISGHLDPNDVVPIVRGVAGQAIVADWFARLRGSIPRDARGMGAFYAVLSATVERLEELGFDNPRCGSEAAFEMAEFLILNQSEIPYDDDLDSHVLPLLRSAALWSLDGRDGVLPLKAMMKRLMALIEMDEHSTLDRLGDELRLVPWSKAQRVRMAKLLGEYAEVSPVPDRVRRFQDELRL